MDLVRFFHEIGRLKEIKRTGWINYGVKNGESVADHSFRAAVMAYYLAPQVNVSPEKAMRYALFHDCCEAYAGDIPSRPSMGKAELRKKFLAESKGLQKLCRFLPRPAAKEQEKMFKELEKCSTKLAKFVKDMDVLELALQALEYKKMHRAGKSLDIFFQYAEHKLRLKESKKYYRAMLKQFR